MLSQKKKAWSSLLAIVLSLTCALSTIPVSAYEGEPQSNPSAAIVGEEVKPGETHEKEDPESTDKIVEEVESQPDDEIGGDNEENGEAADHSESSSVEESVEQIPSTEELSEEDDRTNLALGATYSGTQAFENLYPDTGNKELTDGLFGSLDYGDQTNF